MLFTPGCCIVWPDERIARVLAVDTENELIWMIDCEAKDALPVAYSSDDVDLQQARHLQRDPYERLRVGDHLFSEKRCARRDERLEFMASLLWDEHPTSRRSLWPRQRVGVYGFAAVG